MADDNLIILRTYIEKYSPRILTQKIKKNKELYAWVLTNSSILTEVTFKERIFYVLNDLEPFCKYDEKRTFKAKIHDYGFCNNVAKCRCLREYQSENLKGKPLKNVEKRVDTWIAKYGVDNPSKCNDIVNKRLNTMASRDYTKQRKNTAYNKETIGFAQVIDRVKEFVTPMFTRDEYSGSGRLNVYKWKCCSCSKEINSHIDYGTVPRCITCFPKYISKGELQIRDLLEQHKIDFIANDWTVLKDRELDIFIPDMNIAIEYNGVYWHSDKFKDSNYHVDKFLKCRDKGIHLIQIFEDEWQNKQDIVKSRLRSVLNLNEKIYARHCKIAEIDSRSYKDFCNNVHLQGHAGAKIKLGLMYNSELIAVMSFSNSRYDKSGDYELIRYCSVNNVLGGASRLFKYFVKLFEPKTVISYANRCWSNGDLYNKLGFEDITDNIRNTGYWYIIADKRYHRSTFTKKRLVGMGYDSSLTEPQIIKQMRGLKIYDCGNFKFKYENNTK